MERRGLIVRKVEAVELGEEPAQVAGNYGSGDGELEREQEEACQRDKLSREKEEAVFVEFFFRGG